MKLLSDFLPIILFFVVFKVGGIIPATIAIMVTTLLQVAWQWFRHRKVETMNLVTLGIVLLLGFATVILKDDRFIKLKPTLVYVAFAMAFAGSHFVGSRKPLIERFAGKNLTLPPRIWTRLNLAWVVFFIVLALLNVFVAQKFSTEAWVNFKLFGLLGLTLAFALAQAAFIGKLAEEKKSPPHESSNP